jgi:hypothetical protein
MAYGFWDHPARVQDLDIKLAIDDARTRLPAMIRSN